MKGWRSMGRVLTVAGSLAVTTACHSDLHMTDPSGAAAIALQSVSPANGATGVSITMPMAMRFSGPMGLAMEQFMMVHEDTVTGPVVAGTWQWSADRRTATFTPNVALKPRTNYVIHMGGAMQAQNGTPLNYGPCAALGGQPVSSGMMGNTASMSAMGMAGAGWLGAGGGFGMLFRFTTA